MNVVLALLRAGVGTAAAHGDETIAGWSLEPALLIPMVLTAGLYLAGWFRLERRRQAKTRALRALALFAAGWLSVLIALASPLHEWAEGSFTAHMTEHEILMLISAPLLILARPGPAMLWAFPRAARHGIGAVLRSAAFLAVWRPARAPMGASLIHGAAIWLWHIPAVYARVLQSEPLHWWQHAFFLGTAMLFWEALIAPAQRGAAMFWLFATAMHTTFLGILIALSPRIWIPAQSAAAGRFGLSPLEDQQLAGLVMWVPGGVVYTAAALMILAGWIREVGAREDVRHA